MKTKIRSMLTACIFIPIFAQSQTEGDAIRFSGNTFGTTARSLSMGGAFGALGADFSSLSINPAGISAYRKSELTFSQVFNTRIVDADYINTTSSDSRFYYDVSNVGMVACGMKSTRPNWKGWNWGFGYNRDNSYKRYSIYQGFNSQNSLLNAFSEEAQGVPYTSFSDLSYAFDVGLAWNVYLINPADTVVNTNYQPAVQYGGVTQQQYTDVRGNKGSGIMTFGNNYKDILLIGGTLEYSSFRYEENTVYTEVDKYDSIISPYNQMDFKSFAYTQNKLTRGYGFLAKFGVIVKPNDIIRIGAAIHSPGIYHVNYQDLYDMVSTFDSVLVQPDGPPTSAFDYDLTTPFRAVGSIAFIIGKMGLITADYEFVDYPMTKMRSPYYNFSQENSNIKATTHGTSNFRFGGELKWDIFSFRAGAAFYGSPYKKQFVNADYNFSTVSYTGGIGIKFKNYFIDSGYAFTKGKDSFQPYKLNDAEVQSVYQTTATHRVTITMGVKF